MTDPCLDSSSQLCWRGQQHVSSLPASNHVITLLISGTWGFVQSRAHGHDMQISSPKLCCSCAWPLQPAGQVQECRLQAAGHVQEYHHRRDSLHRLQEPHDQFPFIKLACVTCTSSSAYQPMPCQSAYHHCGSHCQLDCHKHHFDIVATRSHLQPQQRKYSLWFPIGQYTKHHVDTAQLLSTS